MGDKPKDNVLAMPNSGYGWKYTKKPFPKVANDFSISIHDCLHLWMHWDDDDYSTGNNPYVCSSTYDIGSEPVDDELIKISLDDFIYEGAVYLLGQHMNITGTLTFDERQGLDDFNAIISNLSTQLESTAERIRKLALTERDVGPLGDFNE